MNVSFSPALIATWAGALIAILIAVLDTWAFGQKFTAQVDLALLFAGIGTLLGTTVPQIHLGTTPSTPSGAEKLPALDKRLHG